MIVNDCGSPQFGDTVPLGEIVPWSPAEAERDRVFTAKLALIVWFAVTFWNV